MGGVEVTNGLKNYWWHIRDMTRDIYITLNLDGEILHEGDKRWPGCYLDITIDLEVQEVCTFEYMVFIA